MNIYTSIRFLLYACQGRDRDYSRHDREGFRRARTAYLMPTFELEARNRGLRFINRTIYRIQVGGECAAQSTVRIDSRANTAIDRESREYTSNSEASGFSGDGGARDGGFEIRLEMAMVGCWYGWGGKVTGKGVSGIGVLR